MITRQVGLGISDIVGSKREEILSIAAKHGASKVRVFGSVARGEARVDSDIDFLIDYDLERISSWFPMGLIHDLEDLLQRRVDIIPSDSIHPAICDQILREAVTL
ncbi:MAG: nucleotidyltransferase family protein [Cyanobacteriota bacterium]|nr:nucleotidyltransferase family protein [Cyanobacteriota bacterium]